MSIAEGDWVVAIVEGKNRRKVYAFRLRAKASYSTFAGSFRGEQAIGLPWGSRIELERGVAYLLRPTLYDLLNLVLPRRSQVIYPKDAGFMLAALGLRPGMRVLEAGVGSGFMTIWAAVHVCPGGQVYGYDVRRDMIELASRNVEAAGFADCVKIKEGDVRAGVEEADLDAAILDMPDPWDALGPLWRSLRPSSPVGVFVPTANQVSKLLAALGPMGGYVVQEVAEVFKREWEPRAEALRPSTRMVGHTGFVVILRRTAQEPAAQARP